MPNNLPLQLTSFIGREREIVEVKRLLSASRHLTLTGAGGCGKTRLALQVASEAATQFEHGVWFVDLAPLANATLVPQVVASALGVSEQPGRRLLAVLDEYLHSKELLLILDNCEHLRDACARLAHHLASVCPALTIFATSREALNVPGEATHLVPSLTLPDEQGMPAERLMQYEAVRLFVERTQAAQVFMLTNENAAAVVQICRHLDGMPLAIELAAARVKLLTVAQIAARLEDVFHLLTRGSPELLPRQQTLRATIDWSYNLLSEPERVLFRRLSVFAGSFTLEAAESVTEDHGRGTNEEESLPPSTTLQREDVLDSLAGLVDKSLVMVLNREHATRYRLLEVVRQYAREAMEKAGEAQQWQTRHLQFFTNWAEESESKLHSTQQAEMFRQLDADYDNLRAALDWARSDDSYGETGLRLAGALHYFWYSRGLWSEGRARLEGMLRAAQTSKPTPSAGSRAKVLNALGFLSYWTGDLTAARSQLKEGIVLARALGSAGNALLGWIVGNLSLTLLQEDPMAARVLAEEELRIGQEIGVPWMVGRAYYKLGELAADEGDLAAAREWQERCIAMQQAGGDHWFAARGMSALGVILYRLGDYDAARPAQEESLAIHRDIGDRAGTAASLMSLGETVRRQGDLARAHTLARESLAISRELGNPEGVAYSLEAFANLAAAQAQWARAARLYGAVEALFESIERRILPSHLIVSERLDALVRSRLGVASLARAWAEGRTMTLDQIIAYALDEGKPATPLKAAKGEFGGLTARERMVAALIAEGKSNRDIADALVVSERTVSTHVGNILSKLAFSSRTQVATWAVEKGLAKAKK